MDRQKVLSPLVTIVLIGVFLWFGKPVLIPFCYAFLTALVLYPICKKFESFGVKKGASIALTIFLLCLVFAGLITLLAYQLAIIGSKWPMIQQKFNDFILQLHKYLEMEYGWSTEDQNSWAIESLKKISENSGNFIQGFTKTLVESLVQIIIIPIYIALLLSYRTRLVDFLKEILPEKYSLNLSKILLDTISVFSRFIRGMAMVYLTVGILNTIGLWVIGIENPLVYGMLSAVMTIIPYFGIIFSSMLPITISWLNTGTIWQPLGVIGIFSVVQYLEANLIFPYVVGRFVNLNTLVAICAIFIGALFWGVAGMILFIPLTAAFRIFAENFDELKPYAKILST